MRTRTLVVFLVLVLATAAVLTNPDPSAHLQQADRNWRETSELRIIMTATADWARIMFDDLNHTHGNGIRIDRIVGQGWFFGNDSDDRIDCGKSLTYVDVIYNATVIRTGDFVGFYKGDNDFSYTRMYVDLTLDVDESVPQAYFFLVVAGAGVTTFQIVDKASGIIAWQETIQGNSFTQYLDRPVSAASFFRRQTLESGAVLLLVGLAGLVLIVTNPILRTRAKKQPEDWNGL